MYCYQCGEKLIEGANFCHVCGAEQSVVKKLKTPKAEASVDSLKKSHLSKDDTKVFYLSGESEEEDLNLYLSKVDTQIKKNIEEFEEKEALEEESNKELLQESKSSPITKPQKKKKKKSFKQIWKDFINEEDNPYSVFGELSQEDDLLNNNNQENILLSNETKNDGISSTNATSETGEYEGLAQQVNSLIKQDKDSQETSKKSPSLGTKIKNYFSSMKSSSSKENIKPTEEKESEDHFITDLKLQDALNSDQAKDKQALSKKKKSYSNPRPLEKKDSSLPEGLSFLKDTKLSLRKKKEKNIEENTKAFTKLSNKDPQNENQVSMELVKNRDSEQISTNKDASKDTLPWTKRLESNQKVILLSDQYISLRERILKGSNLALGLCLLLGIILSILPIIVIRKNFIFSTFIFSLLKLVISLAPFYFANRTARNYCISQPSQRLLNLDTLIHWTICQIPLFLFFFILPKDMVMGHNLLGAMTPHFIISILLYILAIGLSFISVYKNLPSNRYLEYLGWFSIIFILIELFSKLFWVIMTFMSTALF